MNKHVCEIITQYAKNNTWLYWIKNVKLPDNQFENSEIIQSDNYENVCIQIFNKHVQMIFKEKYIELEGYNYSTQNTKVLSIYIQKNKQCKRCNNVSYNRPCYEHYPTSDELMHWFEHVKFKSSKDFDQYKIQCIKALAKIGFVKIKQLNFF